jgi:hypothetical protein
VASGPSVRKHVQVQSTKPVRVGEDVDRDDPAALRAARRATIAERGRDEEVRASELDSAERIVFFRDVLGPFARRIPFGYWFIRLVDGVDLRDPVKVAKDRRVFELHPAP